MRVRADPGKAVLAAGLLLLPACAAARDRLPVEKIRLPRGFAIELWSGDGPGARSMSLAPNGVLFVGTRDEKVYAVVPGRAANDPKRVVVIAQGLHSPNGVAFKDGALYVAEISRVLRFDRVLDWVAKPGDPLRPAVVNDTFPTDEHPGWDLRECGPERPPVVPRGV